ncbi:hypothetical protein C1H46_006295 [Malus baccata]|uniref:Uncharacterized protein n=1 Tax=Malus baccata TaxID=106549 RepID=A0A540NAE1_MALBA|nr:hypothetical protein C1H46_006295 [Malus baccata]
MWCAFGCKFGTFVLRCLDRFHHSVNISHIASSVAPSNTFVAVKVTDVAVKD